MIRGWGTLRLFVGIRGIPGHPPRPRHASTPFRYRHGAAAAVALSSSPLGPSDRHDSGVWVVYP